MATEDLLLNRGVVLGSVLAYWGGVLIQARRVRKRTGRSPNVRPRGTKEHLLWGGWFLVIVSWMALPFLASIHVSSGWLRLASWASQWPNMIGGLLLIVAGHVGTFWCYDAMGDAWRMGINRRERNTLVTGGPYRFVRHPIYSFQVVILTGVLLLLPALMAVAIVVVHVLCVLLKAADEESHLLSVHDETYRQYLSRTGRLWPRLRQTPTSGA